MNGLNVLMMFSTCHSLLYWSRIHTDGQADRVATTVSLCVDTQITRPTV